MITDKRLAEIRESSRIAGDLALRPLWSELLELVECYEAARAYKRYARRNASPSRLKSVLSLFPEDTP